ncbi:MAG: TonB-dependent receptor [Pseudomonadota bacterium]
MTNALRVAAVVWIGSAGWTVDATAQSTTGETSSIDEIVVMGRELATIPSAATTTTRSSLRLIDTPATVTVINRDLIDSQLAVNLQDVLRNASGVNQAGNNYGVGDFFQSRGLPVGYAIDGLYAGAGLGPDSYAPTRSLTNVDRVEVLQGANATIYGAGSAGGLINLIEKKPEFEQAFGVEARAGSYDTYGVMLDATGPINDRFAYRLVGSVYREDGFRDLVVDRDELYGSIAAEFSATSRLTLSAAWIDDEVQVDSVGYPVRIFNSASTTPPGIAAGDVTPGNLPNDPASNQQLTPAQIDALADSLAAGDGLRPFDLGNASLISPIARPNDGKEIRVKARWEWQPADGLTITPSSQWRYYDSEYVRQTGAFNYVYWNRGGVVNQPPRAPLVVDNVIYPFAARRQEYRKFSVREKSWDNFLDVRLERNLFGRESETLFTAYFQDITADIDRASLYDADNARSADAPLPYIFDIRNPNFATGRFEDFDTFVSANYEKDVSTSGVGIQNILYVTPWLITRAGIGWNQIEQDFDAGPTETAPNRDPVDQTDDGFVFNLGATIKPVEWVALFFAYGEGRESFSFAGTLNGVTDRPDSESTNLEVGLKLQDVDDRFSVGLTYFDTARTNLRYNNPEFEDNPSDPDFNIDVPEFFFDGEDSTDGVQLDANLYVFDALFINANATFQDARNRQNPNSSTFNVKQKGVPDEFFGLFGVYEPGWTVFDGSLRFKLGMEYQAGRTINSSAFGLPDAVLPSQTVWDAGVEYQGNDGLQASLQVFNLTDELAYSRAMFLGGQPIAPTSVEFTLRRQW